MYCSDPIRGEVEVLTPRNFHIKAKARSFSFHCPDGMQGEIVYDASSQFQNLSPMEEQEWLRRMKGKIVLSWNYYEDYVQKIQNAGVLLHSETAKIAEAIRPRIIISSTGQTSVQKPSWTQVLILMSARLFLFHLPQSLAAQDFGLPKANRQLPSSYDREQQGHD
jgi:hypothetical protein